jgi:glycosyltransferase involved in cell wall biosynthesis
VIELSVIIPSRNRAQKLRVCLEALAAQTLAPAAYEVVVGVDGSTDDTRQMLASLAMPYFLRVHWQEKSGVCAARNQAAAIAQGRTFLFIDDDVLASPYLAAEHLQAHRAQQGIVGLGPLSLQVPPEADGMARVFAQNWNGHYERLERGHRQPAWHDCYGGNFSVGRERFLAVGGFATDLTASVDVELGYRLAVLGATFVFIPGAAAEHDDNKGYLALAADAEKHGRANVVLCRRHPAMWPLLLGTFAAARPRVVRLRRWLLALDVDPRLLAQLSRLARNRSWEPAWFTFLLDYFYWRGVRQAADPGMWRRVLAPRLPAA